MNKKSAILIALGILTLIGILAGYNYFAQKPKIISSSPSNNSTDNALGSNFSIKFNVPQRFSNDDLLIEPSVKGSWTTSKNRREIKFKSEESLSNFTDYAITIKMKSRLGKNFTETIRFKTKFVYYKNLPEDLRKKETESVDACEEGRKTGEECNYLED